MGRFTTILIDIDISTNNITDVVAVLDSEGSNGYKVTNMFFHADNPNKLYFTVVKDAEA